MKLIKPWAFTSLAPMDFYLTLTAGYLKLNNSKIEAGSFSGKMTLPRTVFSPQGSQISVSFTSFKVDKSLNLLGNVKIENELRWGRFGLA